MIWCVVEKGLCSPPRLTSGEINFPSLLGKMPNRNPSLFVDVNGEISQNQDFSVEVNQERYSEGISEIRSRTRENWKQINRSQKENGNSSEQCWAPCRGALRRVPPGCVLVSHSCRVV